MIVHGASSPAIAAVRAVVETRRCSLGGCASRESSGSMADRSSVCSSQSGQFRSRALGDADPFARRGLDRLLRLVYSGAAGHLSCSAIGGRLDLAAGDPSRLLALESSASSRVARA